MKYSKKTIKQELGCQDAKFTQLMDVVCPELVGGTRHNIDAMSYWLIKMAWAIKKSWHGGRTGVPNLEPMTKNPKWTTETAMLLAFGNEPNQKMVITPEGVRLFTTARRLDHMLAKYNFVEVVSL